MSYPAAVAVIVAFTVVLALLTAVAAAKLVRLDGATYPTAIRHAAAAFTAVLTLAATVAVAVTAILA
ncbi:hypothetical protein [Streptomyces sp. MBT33]|uniref:hypothetical protein n=1 Tax=Streptomyces sp. MBT33 TaxID=1488363 RepID=UPI00190908D4|nr:hypothetical protein [Streptomyces sp. MBT33]MBK3639887.1 hypothetical protein [Streptomyces sp. MBT33]